MKIIKVDNFDRDNISDQLIADNVVDFYGQHMVEELNNQFSDDHAQIFFRLVDDDYELYEFKP